MLDAEALADLTADMLRDHVAKSLAPLLDENGRLRERVAVLEAKGAPEVDRALVASMVADEVAAAVAAIPAAKDGRDVDPSHVVQLVAEAVAALPTPKDGSSVTAEDLAPLVDVSVGKAVAAAVAAIPAAKDGVGLAGALIDRLGNLVITLTDGGTRELGSVIGRDADPARLAVMVEEAVAAIPKPRDGDPGVDADPEVIARMVADAVAQLPVPKDGRDGNDGEDAYPGEACGLFDAERIYRALDVVSFNGSEWRAKRDAPGELPGDGWMLSACRGKKGEPGKGVPGANLIAAYVEQDTATLVMTRDDGVEIKADLSALIQSARMRDLPD